MAIRLEDDFMCYVCGKDNPHGLKLQFQHVAKGHLTSEVVFSKQHQGYKGIVHGGMIAMVLDDLIVNLAWREGVPAVTGELKIRLKKPAKVGERILLEGFVSPGQEEKFAKRLFYAEATAKDSSGELLATAKGTCVRIDTQSHKS